VIRRNQFLLRPKSGEQFIQFTRGGVLERAFQLGGFEDIRWFLL
jgi:hypothetical protein